MIEVETQETDRARQLFIINTLINKFGGRHSLIVLSAPNAVIEAFPSEEGSWTVEVKQRGDAQVEME